MKEEKNENTSDNESKKDDVATNFLLALVDSIVQKYSSLPLHEWPEPLRSSGENWLNLLK